MYDSARIIHFYETCSRRPADLPLMLEEMERAAVWTWSSLTPTEEREIAELERVRADKGLYGPKN